MPGAFNAKLKLIFSLALAVTFTSLPRQRLALDIPPVAFFIPGGYKCVCVCVWFCTPVPPTPQLLASIKENAPGRTWKKSPAEHRVCGEACDFDWRINLNPPL